MARRFHEHIFCGDCAPDLRGCAPYASLDTFLDEPCADCPLEAETNYRVDVSDDRSGSDETIQLQMRFFSTEKARASAGRDEAANDSVLRTRQGSFEKPAVMLSGVPGGFATGTQRSIAD